MQWKRFSMGIRRRVLMLVISGSLLTLAAVSLLFYVGMMVVRDTIDENGRFLEEGTAQFTETFASLQAEKRLSIEARAGAQCIETEMEDTADEVESLAKVMTAILRSPENYRPRTLLDPHRDVVPSGAPYINVSGAVAAEAAGYRQEMDIAANIADTMAAMSPSETAAFVGSKHGYLIAADVTSDGGPKQFTARFLNDYDPREMEWYKLGAREKKLAFTGLYRDTNDNSCITCVVPFYDKDGLAGVAGMDLNPQRIYEKALELVDEGRSSDVFVLGKSGRVLFSTRSTGVLAVSPEQPDIRLCQDTSLAFEATSMLAGKSDVQPVTVDGEAYFLAYEPIGSLGWSFGMLTRRDVVSYPVQQARDQVINQIDGFITDIQKGFQGWGPGVGAILLMLAVLLLFLGVEVADRFVQPLLALADGVKEIARGDLDRKLDIRTGDEIEHLARCVNDMTRDLKRYIDGYARMTAEKEHIATELNVARNIQAGMLPDVTPRFSGNQAYALDAMMHPAREVGGDFYDFYMLDETHLAVTIADVAGKGVPAALFMVVSKTVLKNLAMAAIDQQQPDYAGVVGRANRQLCENNDEMMFVTVFFGVLDIRTGVFSYVNAGHNPPLLCRAGGAYEYLEITRTSVLGVKETAEFDEKRLTLAPGDTLFLYTDGVTEAVNEANAMYSEERLAAALNGLAASVPFEGLLAAVREDIRTHAGKAEQSDDITMMALRYLGEG